MAVQLTSLIPVKEAENVQTTQYTSTLATTRIDDFSVTNKSGSAVTFSVNIVPSGGSAGAINLILDNKTVADEETYPCPEIVGKVLAPGDFISTIAGTANALVMSASGIVFT